MIVSYILHFTNNMKNKKIIMKSNNIKFLSCCIISKMNQIAYFLRSMRNVIPNRNSNNNNTQYILNTSQHNTRSNNVNANNISEIEEPDLSRETNGRRCRFCRQLGHTVLHCDNIDIDNGKRYMNEIINTHTYASRIIVETLINEWFLDKSVLLLKAILSSLRVMRYTYNYTRVQLEESIHNYINDRIYELRLEEYRIIRNNNILASSRITLLIPYRLVTTLTELYNAVYIKIITAKPKLQVGDKECPVCLDSLQYDNIQKTNCNHEFCKDCLTNTIKSFVNRINNAKCPLCRSNIEFIYQNTKFVNETL